MTFQHNICHSVHQNQLCRKWLSQKAVVTCLQSPGAQHAAWFRELQCENMLMAVHDNLYKMEEYAVHSSAEAYVGTLGEQT